MPTLKRRAPVRGIPKVALRLACAWWRTDHERWRPGNEAEAADAQPAPDVATFQQVTRPSTTDDDLIAPVLRFGDPRVVSLFASLVGFCHLVTGFSNRQVVEQVSRLLDTKYTSHQATYDPRRLRRKNLITKIARTHRYHLTSLGRRVAVLFAKTYGRILAPGLTAFDPRLPADVAQRNPLAVSWRNLEQALEHVIKKGLVAA